MNVSDAQLSYCLAKAAEISEQYTITHIAADDPRRCVDKLLHTCRTYLQKKIEVRKVDINALTNPTWGAFELDGENNYIVAYAKNLPREWERFVLAKELFHVVLDQPEYRNMDLVGHVNEITICFPRVDSKPNHQAVVIEFLAEIAAMEFLFPYTQRLKELGGPNKGNPLAIASKYDAPQVYCEAYMAPEFMDPIKPYFS